MLFEKKKKKKKKKKLLTPPNTVLSDFNMIKGRALLTQSPMMTGQTAHAQSDQSSQDTMMIDNVPKCHQAECELFADKRVDLNVAERSWNTISNAVARFIFK